MQHNLTPYIQFILELDKLKGVTRQTRPLGLDRQENSAEHSWQIALLAMSLEAFSASPIDIHRVIQMLLVHDIGEIDTGDTIVYQSEGLEERKILERKAIERIFGLLPPAQSQIYIDLWQEFEERLTPEAIFAHAADRAMPALINLANNGQSWITNSIQYHQVINKLQQPIEEGCPALWLYMKAQLDMAKENGWFNIPAA